MQFIDCTFDAHAGPILSIFNEAIENTTALYDYKPRAPESMIEWFKTKEIGYFPIIGAASDSGELMGLASYGTFRAWPAYKYSVEHSVYVHKDHRGKGLGIALMKRLIKVAKEQQYHVMLGGIDATNSSSIALHNKLGFVHSGTINHAAFKFGKWCDLSFYQLILETPVQPVDG